MPRTLYLEPSNNPLTLLAAAVHSRAVSTPTWKWKRERWFHLFRPRNHVQIFRRPFSLPPESDQESKVRIRVEHALAHHRDIERAFLWGQRVKDETEGPPRRFTGGLAFFLRKRRFSVPSIANLTEPELLQLLELNDTDTDAPSKVALVSPLLRSVLDVMFGDRQQAVPADASYGIRPGQVVTAFCTLALITQRQMPRNRIHAFILDAQHLGYRYLRGRDTQLERDIGVGFDDQIDEYLSEVGLEVRNPSQHFVIEEAP